MTQIKAFKNTLARYFHAYGKWSGVFGSPYFLAALLLACLDYTRWTTQSWVSMSMDLIPSLLGFSLGTYAIIFSLITNRIKNAMKSMKTKEGVTYLDVVNSTFFHFIVVQVVAFIWAVVFRAEGLRTIVSYIIDVLIRSDAWALFVKSAVLYGASYLGYVLVLYSFFLVMAAAMAVYRLATITDPQEG